jgi:hypothetical protein
MKTRETPISICCRSFVEETEALQVLGVFLVSSHAGREVFSITMSEFSLTGDEMKYRRKIIFLVEMNAWKQRIPGRLNNEEGSQR